MALSSPQTSIKTLLLLLPQSMEWFILGLLLYILCLLFSFCCLILKSAKSSAVVWDQIFEFWFEKVGSRQNNIIDCIEYVVPIPIVC